MRKYIITLLLLPMLASAQYFEVFDIDTSEYPIMKAKFYSIDANGNQILNHSPADFEITENGEPRDVISVSCPEPKNEPFSVVIAVDVSGSMKGEELSTLKNSLNYFIDLTPNDGSEICIIAFNSSNYFISDFSTNKSKLKSKVDDLSAGGGTNFDAAFINPIAGALLAMEKAKHSNRNVIIITDGKASGNENAIINKAKSLGTRIFGILIKNKAPNILQNIFESTQGKGFENIITENDFKESFITIKQNIDQEACEIIWESQFQCNRDIVTNILNRKIGLSKGNNLSLNESQFLKLEFDKFIINFETTSKDTTTTITSKNGNQTIKEIIFEPDNGNYEVLTPLPINIPKNDSVEIEIRFSPIDDDREYTKMEIIGDYCNSSIGLLKGDNNKPLSTRTLNLTHPNGGEVFVAGSDTLITWKGIAKSDTVTINFSSDNGLNWKKVNKFGSNLISAWEVNNIKSNECLIRLDHESDYSNSNTILWETKFNPEIKDITNDMVEHRDGGIITVGNIDLSDNATVDGDIFVRKLSFLGNVLWEKYFDNQLIDIGESVCLTPDGGCIVAGSTSNSSRGYLSPLLLKLNYYGDIEWQQTDLNISGEFLSIIYTSDDNIVVSGNVTVLGKKVYYISKFSEFGELIWENKSSFNGNIESISVKESNDSGYITVGVANKTGEKEDYYIAKFHINGEVEWIKSYGGGDYEKVTDVVTTEDGGFLIIGTSNSFGGDITNRRGLFDIWLIKLDSNGNLEWDKSYGGSGDDFAHSFVKLINGNYLISGRSNSTDGDLINRQYNDGAWIFEIDSLGEIVWQSNDLNIEMYSRKLLKTIDNNYVVAGDRSPNNMVLKFTPPPPPLQSDTSDAVFSIIMPEPVINVTDIDMGQMIVGNTKDSTVSSVICNKGDASLHVLGVDIAGGENSDFLIPRGAGDFYLEKGQCQDMMFEFTPSVLGNRTAVATIRTTIGDFTDTITIHGIGIDPLIEATSEVVDFGVFELGNGKDTTVVLVKNVGSTDITITDTRISGPDMEQFTLNTNPVNYTIPAGEEKEFELNYTAKYGGRTSSILEFHYNGVGSPLRSMLFAEGIGGEVLPQVPDAYVGETVELGVFLGKIKPEGLKEVATKFSATVSYNSTLLAPIDKSMSVTTDGNTSFLKIEGELSGVSQIAAIPMKVGLGTAVKSGLLITEFQLYDADGDSVDYDIEPGVSEFNVLGICEEGGTRLLNPTGEVVLIKLQPNSTATQTKAELTLIEEGQTELSIYDVAGNRLKTLFTGIPKPGTKTLDIDTSEFQSGRYYVRLTTPTITKTEILEVVR